MLPLFFLSFAAGRCLCFLDLCLEHNGIRFEKILYPDADEDEEFVLNAKYRFDSETGKDGR